MNNVKELLSRAIAPLDATERLLAALTVLIALASLIRLVMEPSWGGVGVLWGSLVHVFIFWRWFWLEGYRRLVRGISDMGYVIGTALHEHGEVTVIKDGFKYRVEADGLLVRKPKYLEDM